MQIPGPLLEAELLERENRFVARIRLEGRVVRAHVANSGRLKELLFPGARVLVRKAAREGRATPYDLLMVALPHTLVSIDTRLPPALLAEAIRAGKLPEFAGYSHIRREVRYGHSRLDMLLEGASTPCYIETKLVTLVEGSRALFPDAPTARGRRHLEELGRARRQGFRAAVVFTLGREDAKDFAPHEALDPEFAAALRGAIACGVEAYAYTSRVTPGEVALEARLPLMP